MKSNSAQRSEEQSSNIDPEGRLGTDTPIEKTPRDRMRKFLFGVLAGAALVGMLYISGIRQFFFFHKTSPSIVQPELATTSPQELLELPVTIVLLMGDESFGTERTDESVAALVTNASNIWKQAGISLRSKETIRHSLTADAYAEFQYRPVAFINSLNVVDTPGSITILLIKNLRGVNGLSYGGIRAVAIADYTSVYDFRTLAHEIGHQLGLDHIEGDELRLMSEGAAGTKLTQEEIKTAREGVLAFVGRDDPAAGE